MTTSSQSPNSIELNEFTIRHPDGEDSVVYRTADDDFSDCCMDEGKLLIRLGIDGMWTIVAADLGQTAPLRLFERGIAALTEIRDQLERLAPEESRKGRCLKVDDWGRCYNRDGHEGEHRFPTEAQWRAQNNIPSVETAASA